eukprot:14120892-Ditylum_brightwellii.AAC.1
MSGVAMQFCDAVKAILNGNGQSIWFPNGDGIPLEYDATKYKLFAKCCLPTPIEVKTTPIQWIDCHIDNLEIDSGTKPVQKEQSSLLSPVVNSVKSTEKDPSLDPVDHPNQEPKERGQVSRYNISTSRTQQVSQQKEEKINGINWKDTLGHCINEVLTKMLENTTQYFPTRVESEIHAYPVQHHQKSICGYKCVQLFIVLFANFLWAGLKFTEINGKYMTPHVFSTPHCQNQNPAERRIQDVKHHSILLLYHACAPHTLLVGLNTKTSINIHTYNPKLPAPMCFHPVVPDGACDH